MAAKADGPIAQMTAIQPVKTAAISRRTSKIKFKLTNEEAVPKGH
jgi:hypothetical protein